MEAVFRVVGPIQVYASLHRLADDENLCVQRRICRVMQYGKKGKKKTCLYLPYSADTAESGLKNLNWST